MDHQEKSFDKLLRIRTTGRDDSMAGQYNYPYEPTPYSVLERLAGSGEIRKKNHLLDYGSGKGRVSIFLSYETGCHALGVEYDERLFHVAEENRQKSPVSGKVRYICENAEVFQVPPETDRIFFFNPFSVEVLQKVLGSITDSYYGHPREIRLYFYYPSDEYVAYLMTAEEVSFEDEIGMKDLFPGENPRERILIFTIG